MNAGDLDRRVTFRRATVTRGAFNEQVPTWVDLFTVWASKVEISDAERVRAAQIGARMTARFVVWWSPDTATLTAKDQAVCDGRTYDIAHPPKDMADPEKNIPPRTWLEITGAAQADAAA